MGDTYVINEEQADTVRLIYNMYMAGEMGAMKIANELTRLGRLNASGKVKWAAGQVTRILSNKTYAGYMNYGKSYSNNYLEQKRVNNHDKSTYMEKKCDFEPIIDEETWNKCQKIKQRRLATSFGGKSTHGKKETKDLWASKLRCSCGYTFRKNRWHKNKGCDWSYGYQCYNQLNNGSAKRRREAGQDDTGYCDQRMIADWKLELMAKTIIRAIWLDRKDTIKQVCSVLKECYQKEPTRKINVKSLENSIIQLEQKKEILIEMRTDGEISKEEFSLQKSKIDDKIDRLRLQQLEEQRQSQDNSEYLLDYEAIEKTLSTLIDFEQPKISRDIVEKLVTKIVPNGENRYVWYMNLGNTSPDEFILSIQGNKKAPLVNIDTNEEKSSIHINGDTLEVYSLSTKQLRNEVLGCCQRAFLHFQLTLQFEDAYAFRRDLGQYVRASQWTDINVDIVI